MTRVSDFGRLSHVFVVSSGLFMSGTNDPNWLSGNDWRFFFSGLKLHNILHFRFSMVKLKGRTEASINVLLDLL